MELKVKRVTLVKDPLGTDKLICTLDTPTPYPNLGHPGISTIEIAHGYGQEWCEKVGLTINETVEMNPPYRPKEGIS